MDVNFMRNQRIKKMVCGSYNFTFVYALIYLLLMLVKRVLCSPDWNSGTKKKRIANFHQKRVSFRFWSHKECDQMHIDTKKFLFRVKSRIKDRYMSTVILQNSRYFLFFLMALRVDLLSVRLMRVSVDERERRLGDPCSRFIGVRDIDKTRSATRVTTPWGRAVAKVTRSDSIWLTVPWRHYQNLQNTRDI